MLNAVASRAAKQSGQQLALDYAGDWKDAVLLELRGWIAIHKARGNSTMTMEQFRAEAREQPASHYAWGPLPAIACKAGLIAAMNHADGSPVMRRAESVKTHSHHVRVWQLLDSFPAGGAGTDSPNTQDATPVRQSNQPSDIASVGDVRHGGGAAGLLSAVQAFHRVREG